MAARKRKVRKAPQKSYADLQSEIDAIKSFYGGRKGHFRTPKEALDAVGRKR